MKTPVTTAMMFRCRQCGRTLHDIDTVLGGACSCGSTRFILVPESSITSGTPSLDLREQIRLDLHRWLDLNIDAIDTDDLTDLRVSFHIGRVTEQSTSSRRVTSGP